MALIKCTECGKEISDKAEVCPHCGFNSTKAKLNEAETNAVDKEVDLMTAIPIILVGIVFFGFIIYLIMSSSKKERSIEPRMITEESKKEDVEFACRTSIKDVLNDPDSAKFEPVFVEEVKGGYIVHQDLRAKNAFGGLVKSSFLCAAKYTNRAVILGVEEVK